MRLAGLSIGGFYATPPESLRRLAAMLRPADEAGSYPILDPCAGYGDALAAVSEQLHGEPYAVELQRDRAAACRDRFPHAFWGDAFSLHVTAESMSLLWLNPPYDKSAAGRRAYEAEFLKKIDRALAPGGVLVYLIPQDRLDNAAAHLAGHYVDVQVWKFPSDEFASYSQVAVVARKAGVWSKNDDVANRLVAYANNLLQLDELPEAGTVGVLVPAQACTPKTFELAGLDVDQALEAMHGPASAWRRGEVVARLWPDGVYRVRPLMSPRRGHLAQLLAGGYLDNVLIETPDGPLVVKGQIRKLDEETYNDPDTGVRKVMERLVTKLTVLDTQRGTYHEYQGESLNEFVARYTMPLIETMVAQFPAEYGPEHEALISIDGLGRAPIGGQTHMIRAGALGLSQHKGLIFDGEPGVGKTGMTTAIVQAANTSFNLGLTRNLIDCPGHLISTWKEEIEVTMPRARVFTIKSPKRRGQKSILIQLDEAMTAPASAQRPVFIIISKQQAKLSYRNRSAAITRHFAEPGMAMLACPDCWNPLVDDDGEPLLDTSLDDRRVRCLCSACRNSSGGKHRKDCRACCGTVIVAPNVAPRLAQPGYEWLAPADVNPRPGGRIAELRRRLAPSACLDGPERLACFPPAWAGLPAAQNPRRYEGARYLHKRYGKGKWVCPECGSHAQATHAKHRCFWCDVPMRRSRIDLFVCDEAHEEAKESTAVGRAAAVLTTIARKQIALSGSIHSGYASSVFYILYHFCPEFRRQFGYRDLPAFVARFGVYERIYTTPNASTREDLDEEVGAVSKRGRERVQKVERPGTSPAIILHTIGVMLYFQLSDLGMALPPYREHVRVVPMDEPLTAAYTELKGALDEAANAAVYGARKRVAGRRQQMLIEYPSTCVQALDQHLSLGQGTVVPITAPALSSDHIYPLEQELLDIVREEVADGRRVLVYYQSVGVRDLSPRFKWLMEERARIPYAVLHASVDPTERKAWFDRRMQEGAKVIFCNPSLVETGLTLLWANTLVWYQLCWRTLTVRQASRRSYRIPQTLPVKVFHLVYEHTEQVKALHKIATKVATGSAFDGDLDSDGLEDLAESTALGALAKSIYSTTTNARAGIERLFTGLEHITNQADAFVDSRFGATDIVLADSAVPEISPVSVLELAGAAIDGQSHSLRDAAQLGFVFQQAGESVDSIQMLYATAAAEQQRRRQRRASRAAAQAQAAGQLFLFAAA